MLTGSRETVLGSREERAGVVERRGQGRRWVSSLYTACVVAEGQRAVQAVEKERRARELCRGAGARWRDLKRRGEPMAARRAGLRETCPQSV